MILKMYDSLTDFGKKVILGVILSAIICVFLTRLIVMLG